MTPPRIFPSWEEIERFRNPLTAGERALANFLDKHLSSAWEIYVQPFMNGDRPDIVLLNPKVGLMIFEVKDWNLANYKVEQQERRRQYFVRDKRGWHAIPDPQRQVRRYRDNLVDLYSPFIGRAIAENPQTLAAFRTGVYLHKASTVDARQFIQADHRSFVVVGHDGLTAEKLAEVVPDAMRTNSLFMHDDWLEGLTGLRAWLNPPFHAEEQNRPLALSTEQTRHVNPSPGQHLRLRGVAGSGKTLVLAQRAANLAAQGKRVLVVTYNITLWHYIRDMVSRARKGFDWSQIEFTHFHGFCRDFLLENDIEWPKQDGQDVDTFLDETIPALVTATLRSGRNAKDRRYDAIMIDEGQDFVQTYYDMLCQFLTDNDEVFFVADYRQNVYLRKASWLDAMTGTKFRGRWRELKESYRLPAPVVSEANRFADLFLTEQEFAPLPAQPQLGFFDPTLIWQNVSDYKEPAHAAFHWLKNKGISPVDVVFLVPTHKDGWQLVHMFQQEHIAVNHIFEDEDGDAFSARHKLHKRAFWMGNPCLKICTTHSFKGWELRHVIVVTPADESGQDSQLDYLMYIALTRTRETLIVLNRHSKYSSFGASWQSTLS